jgi:hypothetical protein
MLLKREQSAFRKKPGRTQPILSVPLRAELIARKKPHAPAFGDRSQFAVLIGERLRLANASRERALDQNSELGRSIGHRTRNQRSAFAHIGRAINIWPPSVRKLSAASRREPLTMREGDRASPAQCGSDLAVADSPYPSGVG